MPTAPHDVYDQLMPHTIYVGHKTGAPGFDGKVTGYGADTAYKCLLEDKAGVRRSAQGVSNPYTRIAYCNTDGNAILVTDKISFGDGVLRPLVDVSTYYDEDGAIYTVTVYVQ